MANVESGRKNEVAFFELLVADSRMLLWLKDVFTYLVKP
jgi:hypothetical protein